MKLLFLYNKYYITIIQMSYYYNIDADATDSNGFTTSVQSYACNPISNAQSTTYNGKNGIWTYWYWKFNSTVGRETNLTENNISFDIYPANGQTSLPTQLVGFMYICGQGGQGGAKGVAGGGAGGGGEIYIDTLPTLEYLISAKLYDTSMTTKSSYYYDVTISVGSGTSGSAGTSTNGGDGGNGGKGGSGGLGASGGNHYYFGGSGGGGGAGGSGGKGGLPNTYGGKEGTVGTSTSNGLGYSTAVYFPDGTSVSNKSFTTVSSSNLPTVGLAGNGGASGASGNAGNTAECMFAIFNPIS